MILTTIKSQRFTRTFRVVPFNQTEFFSPLRLVNNFLITPLLITRPTFTSNYQRIILYVRKIDISAKRFSVNRNLRNSNASNPFVTSKSPIFARLSVNHPQPFDIPARWWRGIRSVAMLFQPETRT